MHSLEVASDLTRHALRWKDCQQCTLCHTRKRVVFGRGKVPCDILFVGEAPGDSEDVTGKAFIGEAGHLLDQIIARAVPSHLRLAFTNLVACLPIEQVELAPGQWKREKREPEVDEIKACAPRLAEFAALAKPRLLVAVGAMARDWVSFSLQDLVLTQPTIDITHPAAILRANVAMRSIQEQRCVVRLQEAVEAL